MTFFFYTTKEYIFSSSFGAFVSTVKLEILHSLHLYDKGE